jgi:hypothetical protein
MYTSSLQQMQLIITVNYKLSNYLLLALHTAAAVNHLAGDIAGEV